MKLHRRKSFILTIAVIFTLSMLSSVFAFAATENELRNNLDDVESAQDELSRQMTQLSKDIKSLQSDVDALNAKISKTSHGDYADGNEDPEERRGDAVSGKQSQ